MLQNAPCNKKMDCHKGTEAEGGEKDWGEGGGGGGGGARSEKHFQRREHDPAAQDVAQQIRSKATLQPHWLVLSDTGVARHQET